MAVFLVRLAIEVPVACIPLFILAVADLVYTSHVGKNQAGELEVQLPADSRQAREWLAQMAEMAGPSPGRSRTPCSCSANICA